MKYLFALLLTSSPLIASAEAIKPHNVYFRVDAGNSSALWKVPFDDISQKIKTNKFFGSYGIAMGYILNDHVKIDINGQSRAYRFYGLAGQYEFSQNIDNYSVFSNIYFTMPTSTVFNPYITAGAGFSSVLTQEMKCNLPICESFATKGLKSNAFAWNFGGGVIMKMYKNVDIDIAYRYLHLGKSITNYTNSNGYVKTVQSMDSHQMNLGVIFKIPVPKRSS